ncbi:methyltransferase domain-containing protein [Nocardia sp. NBC_01377]|uniref:class I SAM-dependent methyltransferase n=1 Tax=Nocardia sp. NBC_01377 TaxID=2903595 RepID=UPI0032431D1B
MRAATIEHLVCPYTGGPLVLDTVAARSGDDIDYGLVRGESFEFPIVAGVLLLGLGKGYGGHEEALAPYVPIQAAAVDYLRRGDVEGLLRWLRAHSPLVHRLAIGGFDDYEHFAVESHIRSARLEAAALAADADYGVLGDIGVRRRLARALPAPVAARAHRRLAVVRARAAAARARRSPNTVLDGSFYAQRFYSPRAAATALQVARLPIGSRVLSLCGGHGMFENLLARSGRIPEHLVCLDGQLINLLAVKRFVTAEIDAICSDAQFHLPFRDGSFDAVFSSTCLPEIPAQAHFIRESIRVTDAAGWTMFDSMWALDSGVLRCDPYRPYRYLQNFLPRVRDYRAVIDRFAGARTAGYAISRRPADLLDGPRWAFEDERIIAELSDPVDTELNALVIDRERFPGFVDADHSALAGALSPSPAYRVERGPDAGARLRRRPEFDVLSPVFASSDFAGLPGSVELGATDGHTRRLELFAAGALAALPIGYRREQRDDHAGPHGQGLPVTR